MSEGTLHIYTAPTQPATAYVAAAAADAWAGRKTRIQIRDRWLRLILDCCAVGERVEIPQVRALCNLP